MKTIASFLFILAIGATSASAATAIFNPDFNNQTGYTPVTSGGGTLATSGDTMTDSDLSVNGEDAYATVTTGAEHNATVISTTLVFTPTFTYNSAAGVNGASDDTLFTIHDPNSNGNLLSVDLFVDHYLGRDELTLNSDFQYGQGVQTGAGMQTYDTTPAYGSINSLSGHTLTLDDVETYDTSNEDANFGGVVISNYGKLYDGSTLVYTYNFSYTSRDNTVSSDIDGSNFQPTTDDLTISAGVISNSTSDNFLDSGASVTFSKVLVTVPEPSTYALMFGGMAALLLVVRRRMAR